PGADAPAHRRLGRRRSHLRVVGEAEIVVRAQQQHGVAVEKHRRALRPRYETQPTAEPEFLELRQPLFDVAHLSAAPAGGCAPGPLAAGPSAWRGSEAAWRGPRAGRSSPPAGGA